MSGTEHKFTPPWWLKFAGVILVYVVTVAWWAAKTPSMADVRHEIEVATKPFAAATAKYDTDREVWGKQLTTISVQLSAMAATQASLLKLVDTLSERVDRALEKR